MINKSTISKLTYTAIAILLMSNTLLNYTSIDPITSEYIFAMNGFEFVVNDSLYNMAGIVSKFLDTGIMIVILTLQRIQTTNAQKDNSSMEYKINLLLSAQAESLLINRSIVQQNPYIGDEERETNVRRLGHTITVLSQESTKSNNIESLPIQEQINYYNQQKETYISQLTQATKEQDKSLIKALSTLVSTVEKKVMNLVNSLNKPT